MKMIKYLIGILVVAGLVVFAVDKFDLMKWKDRFFTQEELKIDPTASIVEEIRKISEFTSACYYEEYVIQDTKEASGNALLKMVKSKPEVVILSKGKVRAGVDLGKITPEDIKVSNDTLRINLPQPEIFDVIVNPSDYEIFSENGDWSHDEISRIIQKGKENLQQHALDEGIIGKAGETSKKKLESLFQTLGYNVVEIILPK